MGSLEEKFEQEIKSELRDQCKGYAWFVAQLRENRMPLWFGESSSILPSARSPLPLHHCCSQLRGRRLDVGVDICPKREDREPAPTIRIVSVFDATIDTGCPCFQRRKVLFFVHSVLNRVFVAQIVVE